jgi:hypothetical protein
MKEKPDFFQSTLDDEKILIYFIILIKNDLEIKIFERNLRVFFSNLLN